MKVYKIYQSLLEEARKLDKLMSHLKQPYSEWITLQKETIQAKINHSR
jgi:hypothetical protein